MENVFVFIEILFKMLLFKGGVLIYAEHCIYIYIYIYIYTHIYTYTYIFTAVKTLGINYILLLIFLYIWILSSSPGARCAACSVRKGLIFLMLWSANLQDRAVFAMCSLKVSWSSKITPRFLTEADGVIVDEPNWIVKSCCRVGVAGKTRSSVFVRLSCMWCSFIHAEMSAR